MSGAECLEVAMQRVDFQVSISGQDPVVIRVEYEPKPVPPEIAGSPYDIMGFKYQEAVEHLEQQIGHGDFEIEYWTWLV